MPPDGLPSPETADPREWAEQMLADGFVRESSVPLLVQIHTPRTARPRRRVRGRRARHLRTPPLPAWNRHQGDPPRRLPPRPDPDQVRMTVLWAMLRHTANRHDEPSRTVLTRLARHRIDWTAHDLSFLLRCLTEHDDTYYAEAAHRTALTACEQVDDAVLRQCEQHVRTLHRRHGGAEHQGYAAHRRIGARLDRLVERLDGVPTGARERFGADVGPLLAAEIPDTMDSPDLAELLALCAQIRTVRPNRRW